MCVRESKRNTILQLFHFDSFKPQIANKISYLQDLFVPSKQNITSNTCGKCGYCTRPSGIDVSIKFIVHCLNIIVNLLINVSKTYRERGIELKALEEKVPDEVVIKLKIGTHAGYGATYLIWKQKTTLLMHYL